MLEKEQVEAAGIITVLRVNSSRSCLYNELGGNLRRTQQIQSCLFIK